MNHYRKSLNHFLKKMNQFLSKADQIPRKDSLRPIVTNTVYCPTNPRMHSDIDPQCH